MSFVKVKAGRSSGGALSPNRPPTARVLRHALHRPPSRVHVFQVGLSALVFVCGVVSLSSLSGSMCQHLRRNAVRWDVIVSCRAPLVFNLPRHLHTRPAETTTQCQ